MPLPKELLYLIEGYKEFKERYLNQPYGDLWLKLLPLAYTRHPYSWPTIGVLPTAFAATPAI